MIEVTHIADRLTIEDGNVKASVVGAFVVILIAGAGLIGCSLVVDYQNFDIYRERELSQPTPWLTIGTSVIILLLMVVAPLQWHNRIVFDRAQGTFAPSEGHAVRKICSSGRVPRIHPLRQCHRLPWSFLAARDRA